MIIRNDERKIEIKHNMRDGQGDVILEHILSKSEMYGKGRLFTKLILKPGCSIGHHIHDEEMEAFYVLSGIASYNDNGTLSKLHPADTALTVCGEGHSISNETDENVELIALIIYK